MSDTNPDHLAAVRAVLATNANAAESMTAICDEVDRLRAQVCRLTDGTAIESDHLCRHHDDEVRLLAVVADLRDEVALARKRHDDGIGYAIVLQDMILALSRGDEPSISDHAPHMSRVAHRAWKLLDAANSRIATLEAEAKRLRRESRTWFRGEAERQAARADAAEARIVALEAERSRLIAATLATGDLVGEHGPVAPEVDENPRAWGLYAERVADRVKAELAKARATLHEAADLFIAIQAAAPGGDERRAIVAGVELAAKIDAALTGAGGGK